MFFKLLGYSLSKQETHFISYFLSFLAIFSIFSCKFAFCGITTTGTADSKKAQKAPANKINRFILSDQVPVTVENCTAATPIFRVKSFIRIGGIQFVRGTGMTIAVKKIGTAVMPAIRISVTGTGLLYHINTVVTAFFSTDHLAGINSKKHS